LRIAAHHPTLYIEGSMSTGLVGKVYGGVIRRYEGKRPWDVDAEAEAAGKAALAACVAVSHRGSATGSCERRMIG
jgi:hypothetical protein